MQIEGVVTAMISEYPFKVMAEYVRLLRAVKALVKLVVKCLRIIGQDLHMYLNVYVSMYRKRKIAYQSLVAIILKQ